MGTCLVMVIVWMFFGFALILLWANNNPQSKKFRNWIFHFKARPKWEKKQQKQIHSSHTFSISIKSNHCQDHHPKLNRLMRYILTHRIYYTQNSINKYFFSFHLKHYIFFLVLSLWSLGYYTCILLIFHIFVS